MALTNSERQARYVQRLKDRAQLTPKLAWQWTNELCFAWDAIQPMEVPWRKLVANRTSVAAALKTLDELARPAFAKTEDQRLALSRMRLLLDALALRDLSEH